MSAPFGAGSDTSNSTSDVRNYSFTVPAGVTASTNIHVLVTSEDTDGELPSDVEVYLQSGGAGSGSNLTYIDGQVLEDGTDNMMAYYALDDCPCVAGDDVTVTANWTNDQNRRGIGVFFTNGYAPESVLPAAITKNSSGSGDCTVDVASAVASDLIIALYNTGADYDTVVANNCTELINDASSSMSMFVGYVDPGAATNDLPATGAGSRSTAMAILLAAAGGTPPTLGMRMFAA